MKRAVLLVLVLTASLGIAGVASAQAPGGGLLVTRVCGENECKRIFNGVFLIRPGDPTPAHAAPPPIGDYFVLEPSNYRSEGQANQAFGPVTPAFFVPDGGVLRARADPLQLAPQVWLQVSPGMESALREALSGLDPFPAPRLTEVLIAGREAGHPNDYRDLYDAFPAAREPVPNGRGPATAIVLRSDRPTPWTDGHNRVAYYRDLELLSRDGEWVRTSSGLSDRIDDPAASGADPPWGRIGGTLGPLVVLGAIVALWLLTGKRRTRKLDSTAA
jgi:hypothetical protein